jgi:hypothetical protein
VLRAAPLILRSLGLLGGCAAAVLWGWALAAPPLAGLRSGGAASGFPELVTAACAAALLASLAWLVATTALDVTARLLQELAPGRAAAEVAARLADRCTPSLARRIVGIALGLAAAAGAATPATADTGIDGLPLPDRTTGSSVAARAQAPRAATAGTSARRQVIVQPGDSLWTIAAELLPPTAGDAEVARACSRLHRANAGRIGDDPDLILPGTRLSVPGSIASLGKGTL